MMSNDMQAPPPPPYCKLIGKIIIIVLVFFDLASVGYQQASSTFPEGSQAYTAPQQGQPDQAKYPGGTLAATPIVYGVAVAPAAVFSRNPVQCTCPNCRAMIITRTEETNGLLAWLLCVLLVVFGCWLGCCLIPFCIPDLQDVKHYCPNCSAFLGEHRPL